MPAVRIFWVPPAIRRGDAAIIGMMAISLHFNASMPCVPKCGITWRCVTTISGLQIPPAQVWAAEFQGGPVSTGFQKGRVPSANDIRRWMLTALGSGATGISFWVTRAEIAAVECNGFSLLNSVGDTTPRFEEVSRIGQALNRHAELFGQPDWPQSPVAIFINERNYQHCVSMVQGGEHLSYSTRGWYRLLWDAGIPVDFVEAMELDEPRVAEYKAIIMPFPLALSGDVAKKLARVMLSPAAI